MSESSLDQGVVAQEPIAVLEREIGFVGLRRQVLFIDIETKALPDVESYLPDVQAPANYKDVEKIESYKVERRAELIKKAALDPDSGSIAAVSICIAPAKSAISDLTPGHIGTMVVDNNHSESDVVSETIRVMNETLRDGVICGFNITEFDIPFIAKRAFAYGLKTGLILNSSMKSAKFNDDHYIDLFWRMYEFGNGKGLKWLARRYNLDVLVPDVTGADVASMTPGEIAAYCQSDVWLTVQLASKMDGIYFNM